MTLRVLYLVSYRQMSTQCAHFAIFVPSGADPAIGTSIHAIGAPMAGYRLEFKRNYSPAASTQANQQWPIGEIDASHVVDAVGSQR